MSIRQPFNLLDKPVPSFELSVENTALIIVDVQRLTVDESGGLARLARDKGIMTEFNEFFKLVRVMIPNIRSILGRCRELGVQVFFTRMASLTKDGRDISLQNKARGRVLTVASEDSHFIEELHPVPGDIVIDKGCDNPFNCTDLENVLRNLGVRYLILCGVRTPGYLNTTALDAADRGFGVVFVSDACAGGIYERKDYLTSGLIRVRSTSLVLDLLSPLSEGGEPR